MNLLSKDDIIKCFSHLKKVAPERVSIEPVYMRGAFDNTEVVEVCRPDSLIYVTHANYMGYDSNEDVYIYQYDDLESANPSSVFRCLRHEGCEFGYFMNSFNTSDSSNRMGLDYFIVGYRLSLK